MVERYGPKFHQGKIQERRKHDFQEFENEYENLLKIWENSSNLDDRFIQAMKNYTIYRLVSILDVQIQTSIKFLIDDFGLEPDKILGANEFKVRFSDLKTLSSENFTLGEIVTSNLDYVTKPDNLNKYFSNINDLDFFEWFAKLFPAFNFKEKITDLLYERNTITHQLEENSDKKEDLIMKIHTSRAFGKLLYLASASQFEKNPQKANKLITDMKLSPEDFDRITNECKKSNGDDGIPCSKCGYKIKNSPKNVPREKLLCKKCFSKRN